MQESLRKFSFNLLILALVLTAAGYGTFFFLIPHAYFPFFPVVPFFLFAVTLIIHVYLVRASKGNVRKFTSRYLGAMALKIFIYIIFMLIFLFLATEHAIPFLISFLVCYAAYTLFEIVALLKFQRNPDQGS